MSGDLEKDILDEIENMALDDDNSYVSSLDDDDIEIKSNQSLASKISSKDEKEALENRSKYIKKIMAIKSRLCHIEAVKEFKINNLQDMNEEELKNVYETLQSTALSMNGFGLVQAGYSIGTQFLEDRLCDRDINVRGSTKALLTGPHSQQIQTCLTIIDIDLFSDTRFINNPYTALLFMTGMNFYGVYSINKAMAQLQNENQNLREENRTLKSSNVRKELQPLSPPQERKKKDIINDVNMTVEV